MTEREKLVELIANKPQPYTHESFADYLLDSGVRLPVRCSECKHHSTYVCRNDFTGIIHRCEYGIGTYDDDFYCAYGEKRSKQ